MSSFTDYTENLALTYLFTTGSVTRPTAWFVGLFTAAPSDTGGGTEVSGSAYARVATGTISGSGTATTFTNAAAIEFAAASGGNWGTIGWAGIFTASTGGTLLAWAPLTTSKAINDGDIFRIPASSLSITLA
jgi:hypothetical protein|tara:strand:+ start:225 stop:620 length:396 start_codon:yes stop_codon:yes gene_type:complete